MARSVDIVKAAPARSVDAAWAKRVALDTLSAEKIKDFHVDVLLTGDKEIRALNRRHLKHDYATDVISFLLEPNLGDVVVSVEFARRFADSLGLPVKQETARYIVHGILHLLGYDDQKPKDRAEMFERQEIILKKIL